MFGYKKRIKALERGVLYLERCDLDARIDLLDARIDCVQGDHDYELKQVIIGIDNGCGCPPDTRPAKVCKHCDKTINLTEVKEKDDD